MTWQGKPGSGSRWPFFGRVVERRGDRATIQGDPFAKPLVVPGGELKPGDWVWVSAPTEKLAEELAGGAGGAVDGLHEGAVRVVASTGRREFPPVDGEWYRLRQDAQQTRLRNLHHRANALRAVRRFFDEQEFVEIEAPLMVPSPGLELHLDAFAVENLEPRFLITSPEYQLKRLLAAGMSRIYSVARCFRRGEAGPHHNPEFTMIEWYRAPGEWRETAADVARLTAAVVEAVTGSTQIRYQGTELDLTPPWPELSVREAVRIHAGFELEGDESVETLVVKARAAGFVVPDGLPWDDVFFSVFLEAVEPKLGQGRPTVLFDWPAPLAALARRSPSDPRVVERFEAYAGGLELCNGFGELTDPVEQRRRFERDRLERRRRGLPIYPIDERFLRALGEGLPPSSGVAVGFDRLVMLACDSATIRGVSSFVADEL